MVFRAPTFVLAASLALASCGPGGGTVTPIPATPTNLSGDYSGTVVDSANGSSAATMLLAQHGAAAGGSLTTTLAGSPLVSSVSLVVSSTNGVTGTMVQDLPGDVTCSFATTGTYSPSSNVLSGTYAAVTGCSGQHGTFSLTQECTDTVTTSERRPAFGVPGC